MTLDIKLHDHGVIEIEGVKFSVVSIKEVLNNPPKNCLFSVRRNGDHLEFTSYSGVEAVKRFFDSLE